MPRDNPASRVSELNPMPPATNASAVRIQASAVRSLAIENRGSGSSPCP